MAVWSIHPGWEHGWPHCAAGEFSNRIKSRGGEYSIGLTGPGHHKQGGGKRVAEGEHHHRHCYHRRHHHDAGEQPGPLRGEGESAGQPCSKAD